MTRTRHLHRSAALATATALFVLSGTAAAAFAGQDSRVVAVTGTTTAAGAPAAPAVTAQALRTAQAHVALVASDIAAATRTAEKVLARQAKAKAAAAQAAATKAAATKAAAAKAAPKAAPTTRTPAQPAAAAEPASAAGKTITISTYVNAPGSQAAIDKCNLVLWSSAPNWLAGHNWCGFQWMAFVKTGTTVVVTSGAAQGTYRVYDHMRLGRQSGAMPDVNADLVLQTCVGDGTGLTLLRRV